MSMRRQKCGVSDEFSDDGIGCDDQNGLQFQVGESSMNGVSHDDTSPERLELPHRKNSRGFFGNLKKKFASSFRRKRHSSHSNSASYNFNPSMQSHHENDSSSLDMEANHVQHRTFAKGFRFTSRARAKSSGDISCNGVPHSHGSRLNGLHHLSETNLEDSEMVFSETSRNSTRPNITSRVKSSSLHVRTSRQTGPKEVVRRNFHQPPDVEPRTNGDASYGFYTKIPPVYDSVKTVSEEVWCLTKELLKLSKYGWYWGPISRMEAEEKLANQEDGSFLVRDSSDERYLLSLSFRSSGKTLHTRVEHCNGVFSFYAQPESEGYPSVIDLIENSITDSKQGIFCYSRSRHPGSPAFPVRLTKPVSRFSQVRSLQYSCRFVIRQATRLDHIQNLPLPTSIKGWLTENQY